MKFLIVLCALVSVITFCQAFVKSKEKVLCYYNSDSGKKQGLAKLTIDDLAPALGSCSHLIYGYASINATTHQLEIKNENLDSHGKSNLGNIIAKLKSNNRSLKVLLEVGGDKDAIGKDDNNKYLTLLESDKAKVSFVNSAFSLVRTRGFDGLDIGWQFPKNKPKKVHSAFGSFIKAIKKTFSSEHVADENAKQHKEQFAALIADLQNALHPHGYLVGVSVLPNVNSSLFYHVPAIASNSDYVNLMTFDFQTPERNPKVADFPAPIYKLNERNPEFNIDYQVQYWLKNHYNATKINVGVAAYGRAWKMTKDSGLTGLPPVSATDGAAPGGVQTQTAGLLSWPEICVKLPNTSNKDLKGDKAPLIKVDDNTKHSGNYAYRKADNNDEHGIWVGYEDPDTAANKAAYVKSQGLGGVAFIDLSFDDFHGACGGDKYPILRAIKHKLQSHAP